MRTLVLLCLLFTTLTVLFTIPTLAHPIDLVVATCKETPDPQLCLAILRSDPRTLTAANTESLILIMIDAVKIGFSGSLRYVENLSRDTRDSEIFGALRECIWVYKVVVESSVDVAVRAVKLGAPKFGETAMRDASIEAEVCLLSFPEGKAPEQIIGWTPMLQGISNLAASMIKILE